MQLLLRIHVDTSPHGDSWADISIYEGPSLKDVHIVPLSQDCSIAQQLLEALTRYVQMLGDVFVSDPTLFE
jgi:hypothetical protein